MKLFEKKIQTNTNVCHCLKKNNSNNFTLCRKFTRLKTVYHTQKRRLCFVIIYKRTNVLNVSKLNLKKTLRIAIGICPTV